MPLTSGPAVNARALRERIGGEWRTERSGAKPVNDETSSTSMPLLRDWATSSVPGDAVD